MLFMFLCVVGYLLVLMVVNSLFALASGGVSSSISGNYECGFLPVISSSLRYRFTYWVILLHFVLFEVELAIALVLVNGVVSQAGLVVVVLLLVCLLVDMLL